MVEKSRSVGHRLISGTVLQMGNMVASAIAAFFLMPFVVHHLGDRIYGFWSLSSSFIVYYGLLDLGLSTAVSQYISIAIARKDDSECRAVFNTAFRIQLMLGVAAFLATAVLVACTPWFCHNRADVSAFREVIAILGTSAALSFPVRVYGGVLYTQFRFDIQSWLAILGLVLRTGLVVCVIWAGHGLLALAWAVCDVAGERASNLVRKAREFLGSNRYREDRAEAGKKSIFVQHLFVHDLNRGYATVSNRSACYFRPDRTSGGHALSSCEYFCAVFHSDIGLFSGHAAASIQPDAWRGRQGRT